MTLHSLLVNFLGCHHLFGARHIFCPLNPGNGVKLDGVESGRRLLFSPPLRPVGECIMECTAVLFPLVWIVSAYWLGGVLPAVWVVRRLTGRTPEEWGDNPGGAGTLRLAGWRAAVPVVLFDVSKGLIPILLAAHFGWGDCWLVATAIAPVAGHNWPLQRGLRPGGKGLATAMGAGLYLGWPGSPPIYVLGLLTAWKGGWAPWAGIASFPLLLLWMSLSGHPAWRLWAIWGIVLLLLLRQWDWIRKPSFG